MNSIKNAIVTVTLLAVGYGAYIVLHNPPPPEFDPAVGDMASLADDSQAPELSVEIGGGEPSVAEAHIAADPMAVNLTPPQYAGGLAATSDGPGTESSTGYPAADYPAAEAMTSEMPSQSTARHSEPIVPVESPTPVQPPFPAQENAVPPLAGPATNEQSPDSITPVTSPVENSLFEVAWQQAQQHLSSGNLVEALGELSVWHGNSTLSESQCIQCVELLDQLAGSVVYSRQHLLEAEYQVQSGETLADIAASYQVPEELLAKINGIAPPYALASGDKLKVVRGPFRAELSLQNRELTVFVDRYYAGRFSVVIGPDLPLQEATYEVAEKADGRSYFDRRLGREVLKGEADNQYGDHWIGLRGDQITAGHSVGIHGRPLNHDTSEQSGAISLDPRNAEDVFSILSVGSRIAIRR